MQRVRAAVLTEIDGPFQVEEVELQDPGPGEVAVRVRAAGVCHSDWHVVKGDTQHPLPVVLGHEGAGDVVAVGSGVTSVQVGDHVVLNWAPDCGSCYYCLRGRNSLCSTYIEPLWAGTMLDGTTRLYRDGKPLYHFSGLATFAEQTVVPESCCVSVRKDVPWPVAALVGCAVTTGVGATTNTVQVGLGDLVAVVGCGGVGLNAIQGAKLCGARRIIAVDSVPSKLEYAVQFGATHTLDGGGDGWMEQVRELTEGRGADFVFEAVGLPSLQEQCLDAVRPGGSLVLVGLAPMSSTTRFPSALLTRQEKSVVGSYYGTANTHRDFALLLDLYRDGCLDLEGQISRSYKLDEINEAYAELLSGGVARGVLLPTEA